MNEGQKALRDFNLTERSLVILSGLCANPNIINGAYVSGRDRDDNWLVRRAIDLTLLLEEKVKGGE